MLKGKVNTADPNSVAVCFHLPASQKPVCCLEKLGKIRKNAQRPNRLSRGRLQITMMIHLYEEPIIESM